MRPQQLPPALVTGAFTAADAARHGIPPQRLTRSDLLHPTHGVHAISPPLSVQERARMVQVALPQDVLFSHVTAAQLWGLSLPRRLESQISLDVIGPTSRNRIRRPLVVGHRGAESRVPDLLDGLRVVDILDTWCDLGEVIPRGLGADDLVVVGDEIVRRVGSAGAVLALQDALDRRTRPRGKRLLLEALALVRPGSRSRMETLTRLMFVRSGLPEPGLNRDVMDAAGCWLMTGDFVWEAERVIGEYQGSDHASRRRRSADAARRELAVDEGWRLIEVFAEDVFVPARRAATIRRFATALGMPWGTVPGWRGRSPAA